jgi:hypothetical protein
VMVVVIVDAARAGKVSAGKVDGILVFYLFSCLAMTVTIGSIHGRYVMYQTPKDSGSRRWGESVKCPRRVMQALTVGPTADYIRATAKRSDRE